MRWAVGISVLLLALALGAFACSSDAPAGVAPDASTGDGGQVSDDAAPLEEDADASADAEPPCPAPDMTVLLDRSSAMARRPDGTIPLPSQPEDTRWAIAATALTALTAAPADTTHRFGLMLFPRDPGAGACVAVPNKMNGATPTNTACEGAELVLSPDYGTGAKMASAVDPTTAHLCQSNPLAAALATALTTLQGIPGKHVLALVTDGRDGCGGDVYGALDALAVAGIRTYVIALGQKNEKSVPDASSDGTVDPFALNEMACAARSATEFATACELLDGGTRYTWNRKGGVLYAGGATQADVSAGLVTAAAQANCLAAPDGG